MMVVIQETSLFFTKLPQELRSHIYETYFSSTQLRRGEHSLGRLSHVRIFPKRTSLALLRTCHQIRREVGETWLGQILFYFEESESMLNTLTVLPLQTLGKIRHLKVSTTPLVLAFDGEEYDTFYRLGAAFKFLPGLQLDVLTVVEHLHKVPEVSYKTVQDFVENGDGWRVLRFIGRDSRMLGYKSSRGYTDEWGCYLRLPQPATWQHILAQRDGPSAKAVVYRSTASQKWESVLNPSTRREFQQKASMARRALDDYGLTEDTTLMSTATELEKALMIVVRRGVKVDYKQRENSPFGEQDMRRDVPGRSWKQIKAEHIDRPLHSDGEDDLWHGARKPDEQEDSD